MMKIILSLLFVLLSVPAFAQGIYLPVASGTVTQANMKISAVDGTSFIDFTAADVLTAKTGNLLVVRDSSGQAIQGFIKAAGTGETYGSNIVSNGNMETGNPPSGWNLADGGSLSSAADGFSGNCLQITETGGGTPYAYRSISVGKGKLFKWVSGYVKAGTGASYRMYLANSVGWSSTQTASGSWVNKPNGFCFTSPYATEANLVLRNMAAGGSGHTIFFDEMSIQQILTPSATGVTITSTKGGTTFNWAQKNASFNYNDPAGFTYQIYKVLDAPVVDSDPCTNANATINLSAGSAAWSCTGIDDSAYQDGKHIIAVYDTAGVAAFGYYKASGSGAVVNAKGGATQNWISIGAGFSTAGNYTRKVLYVGD